MKPDERVVLALRLPLRRKASASSVRSIHVRRMCPLSKCAAARWQYHHFSSLTSESWCCTAVRSASCHCFETSQEGVMILGAQI